MNVKAHVELLKLGDIKFGDRKRQDYGDLDALAQDIKDNGLIQPLAVKLEEDGTYTLVAGGRRYRALATIPSYQDGQQKVPVRVYFGDVDTEDLRTIELAENIYRQDLTWYEQTQIKAAIFEIQKKKGGGEKTSRGGVSMRDVAKMTGSSPAQYSEDLTLHELASKIPQLQKAQSKREAKAMIKKLSRTVKAKKTAATFEERETKIPEKAKRKKLIDSYVVGDFFELITSVPDQMVDFVEIDPPYAIDLKRSKMSTVNADHPLHSASKYNEVDAEKYPNFMKRTLEQAYRILKPDGWAIIWFGPEPWFEPMYQWICDAGFDVHRMPAVWIKHNGQTKHPERNLANAYEMFFYARKTNKGQLSKARLNTFEYLPAPTDYKIHPTERPVELMEDILSTFAPKGGRVVVPFVGSGNTILAAANYGVEAHGYELTNSIKKHFSQRVITQPYGEYSSYDPQKNDPNVQL